MHGAYETRTFECHAPARMVDELEPNILILPPNMKRYDALAGSPLAEDIIIAVLIECCVGELRNKFELSRRDMSYKQVGGGIVARPHHHGHREPGGGHAHRLIHEFQ